MPSSRRPSCRCCAPGARRPFGLAALVLALARSRVGRRWPMALGVMAVVVAGAHVELRGADGAVTAHYFAAVVVALMTAWLALPWGPFLAAATAATLVAGYPLGSVALIGLDDALRLLTIPLGLTLATAALVTGAAGFTESITKPVSDYGPLKVRIEHWLGPTQPYLGLPIPAPTR